MIRCEQNNQVATSQAGQTSQAANQAGGAKGFLGKIRDYIKQIQPSRYSKSVKPIRAPQSQRRVAHVRPINLAPLPALRKPLSDAQIARSMVVSASVDRLESLGAGEITRLSKIMNTDTNPRTQLTAQFRPIAARSKAKVVLENQVLRQELYIESKLQKAFARALNSTTIHPGAKALDKILIDKHCTIAEGPGPTSAADAHEVASFIASTGGRDLRNLSRSELSYVAHMMHSADRNLFHTSYGDQAIQLLHHFFYNASDHIQMRPVKTQHLAVRPQEGTIQHRTELFAQLHRHIAKTVARATANRSPQYRRALQSDLSKIMLRAAHNHRDPAAVKTDVLKLLRRAQISADYQLGIAKGIDTDLSRFQPTDNLALQMESPHARKLENEFTASVIRKPTVAMQKVGQKIIAQLKSDPAYFQRLLVDYLAWDRGYVWPLARNEQMSADQLLKKLESGSDLTLVMDFNFFASDGFKDASFMQLNNQELANTQNVKTYMLDVSAYRGVRVPLPKLDSIAGKQFAIGVGTHDQAVNLRGINVAVERASTIKAAFGAHARESAYADVAQGCGTTGVGNVLLFGQAAINQWAPPNLRFTREETQVYLTMLSAVMTGNGGHTLSETLATAFLASLNVGRMSSPVRALVSDMFDHLAAITQPMASVHTRFDHFDMVFATIHDQDTHARLAQSWDQTVRFRRRS